MNYDLRKKVVLVTGGAVRLGRSICEAFADEGAHVAVHFRTSAVEAKALAAKLKRRGVKVDVFQAALDSGKACDQLILDVKRRMGRVDVLVNNAAVFNKDRLESCTEDKLLTEFWPNLFAPVLLTRAFARQAHAGSVINILDRRIRSHDAERIPYLLSKKALEEFTALAAIDLAPRIRVNGIAPGPILPPPGLTEAYLKEKGGAILTEKRPTPEDVAAAAVFLAKSATVTGQILFVDSGQNLLGSGV